MEMVAWHYHTGTAVPADFAKAAAFYRDAIGAGSWMATINYARLLSDKGFDADAEAILQDGCSAGFVPAFFRLAQIRYAAAPQRAAGNEIRPLLEHAAAAGHPEARVLRAHLMVLGRFGLRRIPAGIASVLQVAWSFARNDEGQEARAA